MEAQISIECSDVSDFTCDVLVLKYAQGFFGADSLVAGLLTENPSSVFEIPPLPGEYRLIPSSGSISALQVLFIGVVDLYRFDYGQIREFAKTALRILSERTPKVRHVAMTMHGVGYGLDERESFSAQIAGFFDAFRDWVVPRSLERITIVERNIGRADRLRKILDESLAATRSQQPTSPIPTKIDAGLASNVKPHVFVAMPFSEGMEDVYILGIQGPVNAAGFLCERVDMARFAGDILLRIKSRIETASLVIADLSGANANVYLEVGYAWGKDRPTLLVARKGDELGFDVRGQRCILYKTIYELANELQADLAALSKVSQ